MGFLSNKRIVNSYLIILILLTFVYSDVRVEFPGIFIGPGNIIGPEPNMYNTTTMKIDLAGWRFRTPNFTWTNLEGDPGTVRVVANGEIETRLVSQTARTLPYTGETPLTLAQHGLRYAAATLGANDDETPYGTYILWKTGSSGIPIDPVDEDPITLDQIDSIIAHPDYYNADYRYLDKIGTNGGTYSGGLLDTYYGQTQIMLAIPMSTFVLNMTDINLDPTETGGPLYWMALAMGQEYFSIDKQLLIATGFKESGIAAAGLLYLNSTGVYGPFHVENWTCVARAVAWPHFYPDYAADLGASANATVFATQVMPANDFCTEYMGDPTPENSARCANAVIVGGLNYWYLYYLLGFSEDICWKNVLEFSTDPYIGIAALAPLYNMGMNSGAESPLHVNSYQALIGNPNGSNLFPVGNSNYRIDVVNGIKALENASQQSMTDPNVQLWDVFITHDDIEAFFFGDGGTVSSQGDGGLLKHFDIDRQKLWDDVQAAFQKLSPHWGQSPAAISWRYDFLTLLRVVKGMFDIQRPKPADYESAIWIENRSKIGGCGVESDDEFPFMEFGTATFDNNTFTIEVNATDNLNVGDVEWTTDYNWDQWDDGTYMSGGATDQDYEVVVQNATPGDTLWISVTDSSGNTIVKKTIIAGPKYPILDSTIIEDTRGNGVGDRITIFIRPANGDPDSVDDLSEYQNLEYSWPTQTNMITANPGDVTVGSASLVVSDNTLTGGAGLGRVTFDYPSKTGYEDDVLDRVGPALFKGVAVLKAKLNVSDPDSLIVNFTEPIEENIKANTAYLNFLIIGQTPVPTVSDTAVKESNTQWVFVFPAGTVPGKDSVNIVHTSGIVDTIGNVPLQNNQMVPIVIQEGLFIVVDGKYLDGNADGVMDSIAITFDRAVERSELDEMEFTFVWLENATGQVPVTMTVPGDDFAMLSDPSISIGWGVPAATYDLKRNCTYFDNSTWGMATLTQPNIITGNTSTDDIDVDDGMAPVIATADYYSFNSSSVTDTLTVTFSEAVLTNTERFPFKFLSMPDLTEYRIEVSHVLTNGAVMTFYVVNETDGIAVESGDSIWIHESGHVKADDPATNEQTNPDNIKRPITVYKNFVIQSAAYLDTNVRPDGYIDILRVTLSSVPDNFDFSSILSSIVLPNYRSFSALTAGDFNATSTGFDICVTQSGVEANTAVDDRDVLAITQTIVISSDGVILAAEIPITDSLAPVITKAIFRPSIINESNYTQDVPDTLEATFSETIKLPSTSSPAWPEPFRFCTNSGQSDDYTMELRLKSTAEGKVMVFLVDTIIKDGDRYYPVAGDSIWIKSGAEIGDNTTQNNVQGKDTKPSPLIVRPYDHVFRVLVFPNPFSIGDKMSEKLDIWKIDDGDGYNIPGSPEADDILILLDPYGYIPTDNVKIEAMLNIFDAVGNTIKESVLMEFNNYPTNQAWYYVWDARNEQGRFVGQGTYLSEIIVKEIQGGNEIGPKKYRAMVGIKKE